jgi:2-hydroxychromene-2-carboxylate isomerase
MTSPPFELTFDYRCPWARKVHLHVLAGLRAGAGWYVRFRPFVLGQSSIDEQGGVDLWDDPTKNDDLLLLRVGVAVRDNFAERLNTFHLNAFEARHTGARNTRDVQVVRDVIATSDLDPDTVLSLAQSDAVNDTIRSEHRDAADRLGVFGVPTFIAGEDAAFVRLLNEPNDDDNASIATVQRILDQFFGWPELNEFKHPRVPF